MKGIFINLLFVSAIVLAGLNANCSGKESSGDKTEGPETSVARNVIGALDKIDGTNLETKINHLRAALDSYYADKGEYPDMLDVLVPDYVRTEVQLLDPWGSRFTIETDEEMNLVLVSPGKDHTPGNSDDIKRRI